MNAASVWTEPLPLPWLQAGALLLAWAWDRCFGEPPNALHPVAWLGRLLGPLGRRLKRLPPRRAFIGGALAWCLIAAALLALGWALQNALARLPGPLAVPLLAALLKPMFAWRMLRDEVASVEIALQQSLTDGRARLARLVSRDVTQLDAAQVREAAIETLAENLNDSLVAPLAFFAIFGLPGALLYRFANTADAMWGYRGGWEWAGKWAARADDVLSWPTARVSAALLRPSPAPAAWRVLRCEAARTPSPNGGWPMGAMALRLGVRLAKPGVYALHAQGRAPQSADIVQALALAGRAAGCWLLVVLTGLALTGRVLMGGGHGG
jgi:adenosylcobinamide-phosphate synthase